MKTAVFTLELEAEEDDLPEEFIDDLGAYLADGIEYYFEEFGTPVDTTIKFSLNNATQPTILH